MGNQARSAAVLALCLAGAVRADEATVRLLRWQPTALVEALYDPTFVPSLPDGVLDVEADEAEGTVTITGSAEGVAALRSLVEQIDAEPARIECRMVLMEADQALSLPLWVGRMAHVAPDGQPTILQFLTARDNLVERLLALPGTRRMTLPTVTVGNGDSVLVRTAVSTDRVVDETDPRLTIDLMPRRTGPAGAGGVTLQLGVTLSRGDGEPLWHVDPVMARLTEPGGAIGLHSLVLLDQDTGRQRRLFVFVWPRAVEAE